MKSYKSVLAEKAAQNVLPMANSLHRSSLLFAVRPIAGCHAVVTLSNHFKIKRGIDAVAMRVWGFDAEGRRLFGDHRMLNEERVYRYDLEQHVEQYPSLETCQVEFFSAANLGMPYPAAIVNHVGARFHNFVHSYARSLNDVFEDDEINAIQVAESSIDVVVDETHDTFVSFLTGPLTLAEARVKLEITTPDGRTQQALAKVSGTRFSTTTLRLSESFPEQRFALGSVLKVSPPTQPMFFGRMIAGIVDRRDRAFSANHTYYDHSDTAEYEEGAYGYNVYPLLPEHRTQLVFYPIQAPSDLELTLEYFDAAGRSLGSGPAGRLVSPGPAAVVLDCSAAPAQARSMLLRAHPRAGSQLPTRISHQVSVGRGALAGSINESLELSTHEHKPRSADRPYLSWIQGVHGPGKRTCIGITCMHPDMPRAARVELAVYGEDGLLEKKTVEIAPRGAHVIASDELFQGTSDDQYFFVYATCIDSRIKMFSVVHSDESNHCSAEHNF